MELTQLLYFRETAKCGNMSSAAEKLHVSQPALSSAIKKLEDELGVRLFEHGRNKIILNETGRQALVYAEALLDKAEEMKNTFNRQTVDKHLLSLGFCDPGPMRFSVPLLQRAYPGIRITSEIYDNEKDIEKFLLAGKYDAVVSLRKSENGETETIPFAEEKLILSLPENHPLAQRKHIKLSDERPLEIAVFCDSGAFVRQIQSFLQRLAEHHSIKIYNDYFVFRQMLENKETATFTTKLVQHYRNDGENRVLIPLDDDGIRAVYQLSYLKKNRRHLAPLLNWIKSFSGRQDAIS